MSDQTIPPVGQRLWRLALLLGIVGVHVLLLLWLALSSLTDGIVRPPATGLTIISLTDAGSTPIAQDAGRMPLPSVVKAPVAAVEPPAVGDANDAFLAADAGAGVVGGTCPLARDTAEAIASDPLAMAELDALPAEVRTSADAVMLWNGTWLTFASDLAAPLKGLRRAVEKVVLASSPGCRDAPVTGPQFLRVADGSRTVTIVIGSGSWRWADLLPACEGAATADCRMATPEDRPVG